MTEHMLGFSQTLLQLKTKQMENSGLVSFPVPVEVPHLTNSSLCHSTVPFVILAASSPRLKKLYSWFTPLFTFASSFSGITREASESSFNLNYIRGVFWHPYMSWRSLGRFRIVTSSTDIFLPIRCLETLVERVAFVVYLAARQRQPLEARRGWGKLLVMPFEHFLVVQLVYGSRTHG